MDNAISRVRSVLLLVGLCAIVQVPMLAQAMTGTTVVQPTVAQIALAQDEHRLQRLIEGAKKEGELTLYHVTTPPSIALVVDAFTKKYGIKVKTWRSSTESVVQRIVNEARGGRFDVDLVENNAPEMEALHREQLLQKVYSPYHGQIMSQAIPKHGEWVGNNIDVFVQTYNTNKVKKEDLPKTYYDLLDPKWKGQLGIEAKDQHWFATLIQALGPEKGKQLFRDIVATNGISVRKGHTLLANLVASGEVTLGLTVYNNMPLILKRKGAPVDWFIIPPGIAAFRGIGLLRHAPHPYAAMLFYDFMLNEGQQILATQDYVMTNNDIDASLKQVELKFIDPGMTLDRHDKWVKDYEDALKIRNKE